LQRTPAVKNGTRERLLTQVFDAAGRRTAIVDARSNRYTFVWDAAERQVRTVDPLSRIVTAGFDAASRQTLRIDGRGNRTTYTFDNASRPIGRQYPDGSRVTMVYDAVGSRTVLADSTGRYTTLYDALNRARTVTNPAQMTISYSFDAAGRRASMVEPDGGRFTYGYSSTNMNTLVVNPQGERTTWQFDANSRVTVQRLANLVRVSYAYDNADRLVRLANLTSTGTTITSYVDSWDGAGNRLSRLEQDGTRVTWAYDPTYQLTNEQRGGANSYNTTYAYNPAGNRRLKLDNSIRTTYSYDAANQLQKYVDNTGTTTFSFDASGNQRLQIASAGGGTTTNTWDFENRLTKAALPSAVLNTFTYNGDDLRVQRQDSLGTLKQVWDGLRILEETDENNVVQVVYSVSPATYGGVISQRRSGAANYFLYDPLGSTMRLSDGSQNVTDIYLYKAFGEIVLSGSTVNAFQFLGELQYYEDKDVGSIYIRMRQYLPAIARWLSEDPLLFSEVDVNLFRYVDNNPLNLVDPSGEQTYYCYRTPRGSYRCVPAPQHAPPQPTGTYYRGQPAQQPAQTLQTSPPPAPMGRRGLRRPLFPKAARRWQQWQAQIQRWQAEQAAKQRQALVQAFWQWVRQRHGGVIPPDLTAQDIQELWQIFVQPPGGPARPSPAGPMGQSPVVPGLPDPGPPVPP
jgi:RHS repeat-associated protein